MAERQSEITPARREGRLARRDPFSGSSFQPLQRFVDEIDRLFDDFGFGRRLTAPLSRTGTTIFAPAIDVFHRANELVIRTDLPGLKKEDVNVEITDDAVTIQGERREEREEDREGYYRSERHYGSFARVIPLPEGAISEQAKATFRNGVLEVTMPAPPASQGRRLEITEEAKK